MGRKTGERGTDRRIGRWSEPRSCSTSQEQERVREEGANEMSGEERLPEEQWRKMGVSGSLRGRRSEEMIQSNTSSPRGSEVPLESQRGWWQLKSPRMKRCLEEGRMEGEKASVLPSVGEERIGGIYIEKRERGEVVKRDVDPYITLVNNFFFLAWTLRTDLG